MPVNSSKTYETWQRYAYCRDNGHTRFVSKADMCERNFAGDQWKAEDRTALESVRRPALTINKILSTMSNLMGEQIYNRAETSFQPRSGANPKTAEILTKVFKQISDNNQLDWKRSDWFADGIIRSRGFLDVRLDYNDAAQGEVRITNFNSKNVILDPDGEEYDPDTWSDAFTTKWVTPDDVAVMYSGDDAELLRRKNGGSALPYGYDSIETGRERFGDGQNPTYAGQSDDKGNVVRSVRLVERQYRMLDKQKFFMSPYTGDQRPIPAEFDRDKIALFVEKYGFRVVTKLARRLRWYVMADDIELHDDWSPYKHMTLVPYFPHFRYGNTIGLVENLLGSQELLNKVSSQELHVVNTTANSGYMVRAGALVNMTVQELEQKGAQTGLVIEVNGDPDKDVQKITPNQVPAGLDRISYKAEEHIKTISGVSDSQMGMDRADVAAKAIQAKQKAGSTNNVKPLDNLTRSDFILARNILDLVQSSYTEARLMTICRNHVTGETETFGINQPNPMSREEHEAQGMEGPYEEILNDLTLGEYGVIVTSVPKRETLEDSQFDQAVAMKELGVAIPDAVLIDSSRLINKQDIIRQMGLDASTPEAQAAAALQARAQEAEVAKAEAEAATKHADAGLRQAKTGETVVKTQVLANTPIEPPAGPQGNPKLDVAKAVHEADLAEREFEHQRAKDAVDQNLEREKIASDQQLKAQDLAQKRADKRVQETRQAAAAAQKPAAKFKA